MKKIIILFYKLDGVFPRHTPSQTIPCSTMLWTFHLCHTTPTAAAIGFCIAPFPLQNEATHHKQALGTSCWSSTQGRVCRGARCPMTLICRTGSPASWLFNVSCPGCWGQVAMGWPPSQPAESSLQKQRGGKQGIHLASSFPVEKGW